MKNKSLSLNLTLLTSLLDLKLNKMIFFKMHIFESYDCLVKTVINLVTFRRVRDKNIFQFLTEYHRGTYVAQFYQQSNSLKLKA